jgi:hypothetical protein
VCVCVCVCVVFVDQILQHPICDQLHKENYGWLQLEFQKDYFIRLVHTVLLTAVHWIVVDI